MISIHAINKTLAEITCLRKIARYLEIRIFEILSMSNQRASLRLQIDKKDKQVSYPLP